MWLVACQSNAPIRSSVLKPAQDFGPIEVMSQAETLQGAIRQRDYARVNDGLLSCLNESFDQPVLEVRCAELYAAIAVLDQPFIDAVKHWLETEPTNYHARLLMGEVQAHAAWAEQGRHYPRNTPSFYRQRATALRSLGQSHFEVAMSLRPDLSYAYAGAIHLLSDEDEMDSVESVYQRARFWVPTSLVVTKAYLDANQAGGMSVYGRLDSVVADYGHQADDAIANRIAAYATFLQSWNTPMNGALFQSPSHAREQLQSLVDLGYDWPRLYWALADVNARLGDLSAARHAILTAVEAAPYDEFIVATSACTCFGLSLDEAVALNERYVARYPTAFYGWRNLARDYLNQGDHEATLDAAQHALTLRPLDAEMQRYRRGALAVLEQPEPSPPSIDYYQSLVLDSLQLELQMAQVRNNVRRQAQPRLSTSELQAFDRALIDHLNGTNLTPKLDQQLAELGWDLETWQAVSTFLFDQAGIADDLDVDYRQRVRLRFPNDQDDHAVADLDVLFRQTVNALVQEFIYRQSQELPLTSGGMTS
ncbi:hypothetical protein BGP77_16125 [Saccharospirillum sp. MSK14-1]|nr:hypothetical protein BGP77_16125 [Saccharospirillum sp. MSK14-1]